MAAYVCSTAARRPGSRSQTKSVRCCATAVFRAVYASGRRPGADPLHADQMSVAIGAISVTTSLHAGSGRHGRLRAEQYHFRAHGLRVEECVPDVSALGVIIEVAVDIGKTLRPEQQIHREKAVRAGMPAHPVAERTAEHRRRPDQAERRRGWMAEMTLFARSILPSASSTP